MIVVAGEALVDLVVSGEHIAATPGGAPYNVARGCARLDVPTALMATLSSDGFGRRLAGGLADSGVSEDLVQRTERPTTLAVADVDAAGVARYVFYVEGTSAALLAPVGLPAAASTLVTGGLGLVLEPIGTAIERVVLAAPDDVLVAVDLNCRPAAIDDREAYVGRLERVLARADVVKASDEDVAWLRPGAPLATAGAGLTGGGRRVVLLTTGGLSTTVLAGGRSTTVPVRAVPVVDTIGAGDAFTAGFVSWWALSGRRRADLDDVDALRAAVVAAHDVAGIVVGRRGADPPRRADLPAGWLRGSVAQSGW